MAHSYQSLLSSLIVRLDITELDPIPGQPYADAGLYRQILSKLRLNLRSKTEIGILLNFTASKVVYVSIL